jgi:hypothetical protein
MNLQENIQRIRQMMGLLLETSEEEAWELLGQEHPVISKLVQDKGYTEESIDKLISIIDNLPEETFTYKDIINFHNLENKKNDEGLMNKMYHISKKENPTKAYEKYMEKRDSGEKRNRGYKPVKNYDRIVSGEYESPVVLEVDNEYYVIGGRTRFYAAIASNTPIRVKILKPSDL